MAAKLLSGNQAVAEAARLARVDVVSAYPITPQTTIIEALAEAVGSGAMKAQFLTVESELSAMASCIGASVAGARAFTATSSQGLLLMHELLHWASGQRLPIVMANVNRAVAPPWSVWVDHTDSMAQRDTGWIQLYAETNQEALDLVLQAYRLAEDKRVALPVMVMLDGFLLSHTYMPVDVPRQEDVDAFLPRYEAFAKIEPGTPQLFGTFSPPDLSYMEFRRDISRGMDAFLELLPEVERDFARRFGRAPRGALDEYRTEDAEAVLVTLGSLASTARDAVDALRDEGYAVGLARLRVFRPFPVAALRDLARRVPVLGVVERSVSHGAGGPVAAELRAAVSGADHPPQVGSFVAGLGGRDVRPDDVKRILRRLLRGDAPEQEWVGLKEAIA